MSALKLLFVEDDDGELESCKISQRRYEREKGRKIEIISSKTLEEASIKLDNTFDGAIVDLKLTNGNEEFDGNTVADNIRKSYRIPTAILTGTPQNAKFESNFLGVYTRGEIEYVELFDLFYQIYDTGLTKIFGGRGIIEQVMDSIFWDSVRPNFNKWKTYVSEENNTEKGLLRFTVSHLLELLDMDSNTYYPEEMYITSPSLHSTMTGNIVQDNETGDSFIVLSPACDLVVRGNGSFKTDSVLVCLIENYDIEAVESVKKILLPETAEDGTPINTPTRKQRDHANRELKSLIKNSYSNYYHYLPKTDCFRGGIINFRKVQSFHPSEFDKRFSIPITRIAMSFTKDIVARFSSFYARQGQPDFNPEDLAETLISE